MAITNQERIGKAMELLRQAPAPLVEREFASLNKGKGTAELLRYMGEDRTATKRPLAEWDLAAPLKLMWEVWKDVFRNTLGRAERHSCRSCATRVTSGLTRNRSRATTHTGRSIPWHGFLQLYPLPKRTK